MGVGTIDNPGTAFLKDYAGDTIYLNGPAVGYGSGLQANYPQLNLDGTNYIYNSAFSRFQAAQPDGGWGKDGDQTWSKETGTIHLNPNSAKSVGVVTADTYINYAYTLDAYQLSRLVGKTFSFSAWFNFPVGQTWTAPSHVLVVGTNVTCPSRVSSTAYTLGQGVTVSGGTWVCVQAGTTADAGSIPTFTDSGTASTVTDGGVIWRSDMCTAGTNPGQLFPATSTGIWKQISVPCFLPTNATAASVSFLQYSPTGGTSTMYIAEPAIMAGNQSQRVPTANNPNEVLIGASKHTSDTLVPTDGSSNITGLWSCIGDVCWQSDVAASGVPAWVCTTAGVNGSGSVWKAMAAVAGP